jgi:hypothetical protein
MKKTMLVLKYERFALNVAEILNFFCFEICLFPIFNSVVEGTLLLVESERMCIIIFVWFFFSIQELKEKKHLKGETFDMLCHFCKTRLE